jgi:hypothetical protein
MKYNEYTRLREEWNKQFSEAYKNLPKEPEAPRLNINRKIFIALHHGGSTVIDGDDGKVYLSKEEAIEMAKWIMDVYS